MAATPQRGHADWKGKVTAAHSGQRAPIKRGSSSSNVNTSSANGAVGTRTSLSNLAEARA